VREYTGHGIGREMHEEPQIPNFGPPVRGPVLQKGMVLAIEPMVNIGGGKLRLKTIIGRLLLLMAVFPGTLRRLLLLPMARQKCSRLGTNRLSAFLEIMI